MTFSQYTKAQANGFDLSVIPDTGIHCRIERASLIKFVLTPNDAIVAGSHRSELSMPSQPFGVLRSYAFQHMVDTDWTNEPGCTLIIFQMHGENKPTPRSPCFAIQMRDGNFFFSVRFDANPAGDTNPPETIFGSCPVVEGKLIDFEVRAKWAYDSTGILEIYRYGKLIAYHYGPNCYNDPTGPYPKFGIYHWEAFAANIKSQIMYMSDLIVTNL